MGQLVTLHAQAGPFTLRVTNLSDLCTIAVGQEISPAVAGTTIGPGATVNVPCTDAAFGLVREWPVLATWANEWVHQILRTPQALFAVSTQIGSGMGGNQTTASATNRNIGKIRRSTDDGQTWSVVHTGLNKGAHLIYARPGKMVVGYQERDGAGAHHLHIWSSEDDGLTWTQRHNVLGGGTDGPSQFYTGAVIPDAVGGNDLFVLRSFSDAILYVSSDGGLTWTTRTHAQWKANASVTAVVARGKLWQQGGTFYMLTGERQTTPYNLALYTSTNGLDWTRVWTLLDAHGFINNNQHTHSLYGFARTASGRYFIHPHPNNTRMQWIDDLLDTGTMASDDTPPHRASDAFMGMPGIYDLEGFPHAGAYAAFPCGRTQVQTMNAGFGTYKGRSYIADKVDPANTAFLLTHNGQIIGADTPARNRVYGVLSESELTWADNGGLVPVRFKVLP